MTNLDTLLKVALSATPGPWKAEPYLYGMTGEGCRIRVTSPSTDDLHNLADDVLREDAEFIATFDPPTVLALLSRLEQAEQAVQRVREMHWKRTDRVGFYADSGEPIFRDVCGYCNDDSVDDGLVTYPCDTIIVLDEGLR